jgi:hypothetical protein
MNGGGHDLEEEDDDFAEADDEGSEIDLPLALPKPPFTGKGEKMNGGGKKSFKKAAKKSAVKKSAKKTVKKAAKKSSKKK